MQRPSIWPMLFVLLLGVLFLREPRLQQSEQFFLRWLLKNAQPRGPAAPLMVIEIGSDSLMEPASANPNERPPARSGPGFVSPLELALFLQSALEFQPAVVAFESIPKWRERDKDQEQVFIDQAMRVPRLLLAAELTTTPDLDAPGQEIQGFTQVTGRRGELVEFSGIGRAPEDDLRLISTLGFINLPDEITDGIHVPLLFRYRGEVIPAFALQAILVWLRVTPGEVKINLGNEILLPGGRRIPIGSDGTVLISPNAAARARHLSLNELLLAAQQRDAGKPAGASIETMKDQIVLARTPAHPLSPPDVFAATLVTIQTEAYVHRVSWIFDCVVLVIATGLAGYLRNIARANLALAAIAVTAAYCLIALALISHSLIWLPGCLPLGALWLLVLISILPPRKHRSLRPDVIAISPPIP
jgi:hypothetical protein